MVTIYTGITVTYVLSSAAIFLSVARLTAVTRDEAIKLFFFTVGLGPITISWIVTKLLTYFPGHSNSFYLVVTFAFLIFLCIYGREKFPLFQSLFNNLFETVINIRLSHNWAVIFIVLIVIIVMGVVFLHATLLPLTGNDPLEYATDARLIYEHRTTDVYPFNKTDPETGFYAPSLHPLGYISLMVWSYMLQGSGQEAGLIKLISPMYVFYTMLLLWYVLSRKLNIYGILGMLLLITTPLYYSQAVICHIDPIRVYTFFLAFVWLREILLHDYGSYHLVAGFILGMSMYSHSIGILTLPFFALIYIIHSGKKYHRKIASLMLIIIISLLMVGGRYISNYRNIGSPISDKVQVLELEKLDYKEYLRESRGLSSEFDRILFGLMKGFSKPKSFGVSYWFLALFVVFYLKPASRDVTVTIFMEVLLLFYVLIVLSIVLEMDEFIKNDRYLLTVQPFIAYGGALFIGKLYEKAFTS